MTKWPFFVQTLQSIELEGATKIYINASPTIYFAYSQLSTIFASTRLMHSKFKTIRYNFTSEIGLASCFQLSCHLQTVWLKRVISPYFKLEFNSVSILQYRESHLLPHYLYSAHILVASPFPLLP